MQETASSARREATPTDVVRCLDAGVNLDASDDSGWTPLHAAVQSSESAKIIEALVAAGADVDARAAMGWTPLYWAAGRSDNPGIMEALIAAGADVHAHDDDGETPLHSAAKSSDNPMFIGMLLAAGANVNARDDDGVTPLHAAGRSDNPRVIEKLVAAGAEVHARTDLLGETPLHRAAGRGNPHIVETLLAAGADVRARTKSGETPLHVLARSSSTRTSAGILDTDVNDRGDAETLLDRVLDGEVLRIIDVLVAAGADTSTRTEKGFTPLHMAAWYDKAQFDEKQSWRWLGDDVQALRETAHLVAGGLFMPWQVRAQTWMPGKNADVQHYMLRL